MVLALARRADTPTRNPPDSHFLLFPFPPRFFPFAALLPTTSAAFSFSAGDVPASISFTERAVLGMGGGAAPPLAAAAARASREKPRCSGAGTAVFCEAEDDAYALVEVAVVALLPSKTRSLLTVTARPSTTATPTASTCCRCRSGTAA